MDHHNRYRSEATLFLFFLFLFFFLLETIGSELEQVKMIRENIAPENNFERYHGIMNSLKQKLCAMDTCGNALGTIWGN